MDPSPARLPVVRQIDLPPASEDHSAPNHGASELASTLSRALRLCPAQRVQMRAVVAAACAQLDLLGQQGKANSAFAMERLQRQIRPLLRAEQQRRFDALLALRGA